MTDDGRNKGEVRGVRTAPAASPPADDDKQEIRAPKHWCGPCSRSFPSKYSLKKHVQRVHGDEQ